MIIKAVGGEGICVEKRLENVLEVGRTNGGGGGSDCVTQVKETRDSALYK